MMKPLMTKKTSTPNVPDRNWCSVALPAKAALPDISFAMWATATIPAAKARNIWRNESLEDCDTGDSAKSKAPFGTLKITPCVPPPLVDAHLDSKRGLLYVALLDRLSSGLDVGHH